MEDNVEEMNITLASVGGMGAVKLPTSTEYTGTGDVPAGQGDAKEEFKKKRKKKKMKNIQTFESFISEEYVELAGFDTFTERLIEEFKDWYKETANNWEDFSKNMAEDSVDEAAKNAQMEILAYLSNEMNKVITDRKYRVKADFK